MPADEDVVVGHEVPREAEPLLSIVELHLTGSEIAQRLIEGLVLHRQGCDLPLAEGTHVAGLVAPPFPCGGGHGEPYHVASLKRPDGQVRHVHVEVLLGVEVLDESESLRGIEKLDAPHMLLGGVRGLRPSHRCRAGQSVRDDEGVPWYGAPLRVLVSAFKAQSAARCGAVNELREVRRPRER